MQVSTLCEDNQIFLYLLTPNTTHILQPADVGPFRALKQYWREEVHKYQRNNVNETVRRVDVAPLMKKYWPEFQCLQLVTDLEPLDSTH